VIKLSVNVNKVATLRNSRGGHEPDPVQAVRCCVEAGAPGITVHPRSDARHIRASDVREIARWLGEHAPGVEYNIEGDPRSDWLALVHEVRPTQATLVPVRSGELTSEAGWSATTDAAAMRSVARELKAKGIRVSMFVNPEPAPIEWAKSIGADRVELYTEPFARAFERGPADAEACFARYVSAAEHAHRLGLKINAGHDLDLDNLVLFRRLPWLAEVSIGHALMGRALFDGLADVVRAYLDVLPSPS
jgi:pyridoxine 5-phosphate synthase